MKKFMVIFAAMFVCYLLPAQSTAVIQTTRIIENVPWKQLIQEGSASFMISRDKVIRMMGEEVDTFILDPTSGKSSDNGVTDLTTVTGDHIQVVRDEHNTILRIMIHQKGRKYGIWYL